MPTIYNTTDGPLLVDRAGRVLGGRERKSVETTDGSPLAGHIAAGRIVVLDLKAGDNVEAREEDTDAASPAPEPASKAKTRRSTTTTTEEA